MRYNLYAFFGLDKDFYRCMKEGKGDIGGLCFNELKMLKTKRNLVNVLAICRDSAGVSAIVYKADKV